MRTDDQNDPINQLYGEHDHALRQLAILSKSGRAMATSGARPELLSEFQSAVHFLENEIRVHNQWEEDHLFPLLELQLGPGGPCSVMRAEHRMLWDTYAAVGPLLDNAVSGKADQASLDHLAFLADSIEELLGNHIQKENEILFPMARRMLRPADLQKLSAARC